MSMGVHGLESEYVVWFCEYFGRIQSRSGSGQILQFVFLRDLISISPFLAVPLSTSGSNVRLNLQSILSCSLIIAYPRP